MPRAKGKCIDPRRLALTCGRKAPLGQRCSGAPAALVCALEGRPAHPAIETASPVPTLSSRSPLSVSVAPSPPFWLVSLASCFPLSASSPGFPAALSHEPLASCDVSCAPFPSSSSGNSVNFSVSVGNGVCVCESERKRERKGKRLLWLVRQHFTILRSKPNQLKNGSPGDRVQCRGSCLWEAGLEEAETA